MDRKQLYTLLLGFWCIGAFAQTHDLIATSGASFQNSTGHISYSIGECITPTLTSSSAILTQGFLQAGLRTGVPVINQSEILMTVYPNPVTDLLILQMDDPHGFDYVLSDILGSVIERRSVLNERTEIDFSTMKPAVYILRVSKQNEELRLFQIVKY